MSLNKELEQAAFQQLEEAWEKMEAAEDVADELKKQLEASQASLVAEKNNAAKQQQHKN